MSLIAPSFGEGVSKITWKRKSLAKLSTIVNRRKSSHKKGSRIRSGARSSELRSYWPTSS